MAQPPGEQSISSIPISPATADQASSTLARQWFRLKIARRAVDCARPKPASANGALTKQPHCPDDRLLDSLFQSMRPRHARPSASK